MKKLITSALLLLALPLGMTAQNPRVQTQYGTVEGLDISGLKVFKGIPFAAPPVGELRWKAPQPAQKWDDVRMTKEYGAAPKQVNIYGDMQLPNTSEDCLYLNVWTPAKTMDEKLPVLIYFNGGGLMCGSGNEERYAGWSMARRGIVCVTANYREGIFGFFAHPQLSKETSYKGSGNYGFLDQVEALRWIKSNIAAFGGDPNRVTIVGESAGSMSVSALMASPLCKGLFSQAIGSSGSVLNSTNIKTLKEAEQEGVALAKKIGCKSIKELRDMNADDLMNKADVRNVPTYNIDGLFLTEQPVETYANGRQMKVPLLIGGNNNEMDPHAFTMGQPLTIEAVKPILNNAYKGQADKMLELYNIHTDADLDGEAGQMLGGDLFIAYSTWKWGNMHKLTSGQPVYRYLYCHPRPQTRSKDFVAGLAGGVQSSNNAPKMPLAKGAVHSADIEYAMGTLSTNRSFDWQYEDFFMSEVFESYYANFIKTGNPNGLGLTEWPSTNGKDVAPVLQLDVNSYVKTDKNMEDRYNFIDDLNWKVNK